MGDKKKKDNVVLVWKGNKLPCDECKFIFQDKFGIDHTVELSRLIRVFVNNYESHKRSVK